MAEASMGHRKFLKTMKTKFYPGNYLPEKFKLNVGSEEEDFSWVKKVNCATIVFLMSVHCSACNFAVCKEFIELYPNFDYLLLMEGKESDKLEIENALNGLNVNIKLADLRTIDGIFHEGGGVPWSFGINNRGQIITGSVFNSLEHLEILHKPFLRVFYRTVVTS